jgi:hypothetical protein
VSLLTTPGTTYQLSFFEANNITGVNQFTASFGGVQLLNLVNKSVSGLQQFTFNVGATSNVSRVQFSGYNVPGTTTLDDVSLTLVAASAPEPSTAALSICAMGLLALSGFGNVKKRFGPGRAL